jgi:hypothetical protein
MKSKITLLSTRWVVLPLIFFHAWGCLPAKYHDVSKIRFFQVGKIPVIQGKINGKSAFFIIDTGASCSILNESAALRFGFGSYALGDYHLTGLGGNAKINQAINCTVEIGPLTITHRKFRARDLDELAQIIKRDENIEIAGILGSDILNQYGLTIDFKHSLICFNR